MVLQFEQEQPGTSLQKVFYQPFGESESSQTSESSRETGDSGNFSQDEPESNPFDSRDEKRNSSENVGDASNTVVTIWTHVWSWVRFASPHFTECLLPFSSTVHSQWCGRNRIAHYPSQVRFCCSSRIGGEIFMCQRPKISLFILENKALLIKPTNLRCTVGSKAQVQPQTLLLPRKPSLICSTCLQTTSESTGVFWGL